jgi:phosphate starvation-inducible protein PhoH and related proteins
MSKRLKKQKDGAEELVKDNSPVIFQKSKLKSPVLINVRHKLNEKQKVILQTAMDNKTKMVAIDGLWGTSKSWLAILASLQLLNEKKVDSIIYIRNPVESSSTGKVGFLPGGIEEKTGPYNAILFDKLDEFLDSGDIERLKKENRIECQPLGFVRGKSWNCKAIIVDEAASLTFDDLLLIASRCGERCKLFIIGDSINQNDIGNKSGYERFLSFFRDQESMENGVFVFDLKAKEDIVRSGFLRFVMEKTNVIKRYADGSSNEPMFLG